jgi:acetyltransferase-like isoleucine patch superfamily enzyme
MGLISQITARYRYWRDMRLLRAHAGTLAPGAKIVRPDCIACNGRLHLGEGVSIREHARIECVRRDGKHGEIRIGDWTTAQMYLHIAAAERVTIGAHVLIAGRVYVSDHDHNWPEDPGKTSLVSAPVTIGDRCWLGEGCVIVKGVTLGENCIVGANAVVTKSYPAGSMLAGVPARVIKRYDPATKEWKRETERRDEETK